MHSMFTMRPSPEKVRNSFVGFHPRRGPDLEQRLFEAIRLAHDRPTIQLVTPVPQLYDSPGETRELVIALAAVTSGETLSRVRRGRPPRNAYLAAEIAYLIDIERARAGGSRLRPDEYLARRYGSRVLPADGRTVRRWLRDGRRVLRAVGAWPWAVFTEGGVPRRWWEHPRALDALARWANGDLARRETDER